MRTANDGDNISFNQILIYNNQITARLREDRVLCRCIVLAFFQMNDEIVYGIISSSAPPVDLRHRLPHPSTPGIRCTEKTGRLCREWPFTAGLMRTVCGQPTPRSAGVARWRRMRIKGTHCQGHRGINAQFVVQPFLLALPIIISLAARRDAVHIDSLVFQFFTACRSCSRGCRSPRRNPRARSASPAS